MQDIEELPIDDYIVVGEIINASVPSSAVIPQKYLLQHTIILGATGSGKTHTCATIVSRASMYKRIILDWHGEYKDLLSGAVMDPYQLPVNPILQDHSETVELLSASINLTAPQAYLLEKTLERTRKGTLSEILYLLETHIDESGWMRESRLSLIRKLAPLLRQKYRDLFTGDDETIDKIIKSPVKSIYIIDLSRIRDPIIRRIYATILLKKIFDEAIYHGLGNPMLIVIEEAQNLVGRDNPVGLISRMLAEIRKFGIGLILVSQSPSSLMEDAMKNTNTKIVHSIKSSVDLDIVSRILYLPNDYQRILPYLDVGEAILYTKPYKKPVIIRVK